ncbi:Methionyl-tRNA synthetase [Ophiocordyceps camponoti-floridani]|uniref:Probable methionine--tRNA ligase, mitochondrial n=1 Tax=Ophiocordyceps camponoti-floridani TaxID=2030778 RepID=A0A8H4VEL0_9HYPO|nr:Methionyl-tRNA synthetase [Ophiocordyceps camponoti-floridani]
MAKLALLATQHSSRISSYYRRSLSQLRWSSTFETKRVFQKPSSFNTSVPYYVTTPIFYVNDAPHIGHLYTMVLADVLKRWQQLHGVRAFLSTGTDEHGLKVQQAAEKKGVKPQELCNTNSAKFHLMARLADISVDYFIRTTDPGHKKAVSTAWLHLKNKLKAGLGLYEGTHKGWYSVADETFVPDDMVQPAKEPQTGKNIKVSKETGNTVEWIEEKTWFFPMTEYKIRLLDFYNKNPRWIQPKSKMAEVRSWVEKNLSDLAVTRPRSRIAWGVRDPTDDSQTIYVWIDALINYLTNAGYGSKWTNASQNMEPWPADVHVVGKDILRFHAVYLPALLMALNLPLPKQILCHNHWIMGGRKMSKSTGNVVDPILALQRWEPDALRYYLMSEGCRRKDMNYSNKLVAHVYVKQLQANLGNLYYRVAKAKVTNAWRVSNAVEMYAAKEFEEMSDQAKKNQPYVTFLRELKRVTAAFSFSMHNCDLQTAIKEIRHLLQDTNRYISETQPWNLVQQTDPESKKRMNWIIFNCAEALRIAGILLQPIMPGKAAELLDGLGVIPSRRTAEYAFMGRDENYGTALSPETPPRRLKKWDALFPPVPDVKEFPKDLIPENMRAEMRKKSKNKMNQLVATLAKEERETGSERDRRMGREEGA